MCRSDYYCTIHKSAPCSFLPTPLGLWVHAPIAPTDECVRLVKELGAPVEYIVLPTFAYEHKSFVGPFSRRFPKAKVLHCLILLGRCSLDVE
jgi:hypothetical protein